MRTQTDSWFKEYLGSGTDRIESSYSLRPEPSVRNFAVWLRSRGLRSGHVLDVGCGRGRNSGVFLKAGWEVTAADIVPAALAAIRQRWSSRFGKRLHLRTLDIHGRWPWANGTFDAVMEVTVADNLGSRAGQRRFWHEAARVLRPGGYLLSYHFNRQDGYYGALLRRSPWKAQGRLYDRRAGMFFRFYTRRDIIAGSGRVLHLVDERHHRYPGPMYGKIYTRDLTAAIFQKPIQS